MEEHAEARSIVERLAKGGFIAYYAGGWVRDLLLKHPSDDIDIATNAPPETIQALFEHTVPIGIAFGIILVIIHGKQYEVATFRQDFDYQDGRRPAKVEFTTAIEDARRRDFTINGMFYDPLENEIIDYVEGQKDLKAKIIRAIGNPHERIKEDRLRMIRGVRLACRFGFAIEEKTGEAIQAHAKELFPAVAIERVWQEFTKGHDFGKLYPMLLKLHEIGILAVIFPELEQVPMSELEQRLEPTCHYPENAPVIAHLLPLFPTFSYNDQIALCKKLKLSNLDLQFVAFLSQARALLGKNGSLYEWAKFYATPFADVILEIESAHIQKKEFLMEHEKKKSFLQKSIQRILDNDPVVKAEHLLKEGVRPGVAMGRLLKEGERISIEEQIFDANQIVERLKNWDIELFST